MGRDKIRWSQTIRSKTDQHDLIFKQGGIDSAVTNIDEWVCTFSGPFFIKMEQHLVIVIRGDVSIIKSQMWLSKNVQINIQVLGLH